MKGPEAGCRSALAWPSGRQPVDLNFETMGLCVGYAMEVLRLNATTVNFGCSSHDVNW